MADDVQLALAHIFVVEGDAAGGASDAAGHAGGAVGEAVGQVADAGLGSLSRALRPEAEGGHLDESRAKLSRAVHKTGRRLVEPEPSQRGARLGDAAYAQIMNAVRKRPPEDSGGAQNSTGADQSEPLVVRCEII